ncbi:MAG TPA: hypothetical protein VGD91_04080 [Trebonia sp.]
MTKDRARKQAIRVRMAASGEPYSVAARATAGSGAPGDPMAAKVAACASATLEEPSARMEVQVVIGLPWVETAETPPGQRRGGTAGLARRLLGALIHDGTHITGPGFAEPAARRYLIDGGAGGGFVCREGRVISGRHGWRVRRLPRQEADQVTVMHWLWPLWALTGTTAARAVGTEAVRGTACRKLIAEVDLARALEAGGTGWPATFRPGPETPVTGALTVWTDERRVRRVRFSQPAGGQVSTEPADRASAVDVTWWDFGTPVTQLDWSRLP